MENGYKNTLAKYLPEGTVDIIFGWIIEHHIHLRISRGRITKMGDYRPPVKTGIHRISVNHNLNPYDFLITLVHEIAHLLVWEQFRNRVKPHGKEWKIQYRQLMDHFLGQGIFPPEVEAALRKYLLKSTAARVSDLELSRILQAYNSDVPGIQLEDLPDNAIFSIAGGRTFQKGEKLRKRFRCLNLENRKVYLISPLCSVVPLNAKDQ